MITQIAEAITNHYNNASELNSALTGGLWFMQASDDSDTPYGVFFFGGSTVDETMGTANNKIEQVELQFNLFSNEDDGGYKVANLARLVSEAFDWQEVDVNDYTTIKMQRVNTQPIIFVDDFWQVTIIFELHILKE